MLLRHPKMFSSVMLHDLTSTLGYLTTEVGLTDGEVKSMVKTHPSLVRYNRSAIKRNVSFFRTSVLGGMGVENQNKMLKRVYTNCPRLLGYDPMGLMGKVDFFVGVCGMGEGEVRELVVSCPSILTYSADGNIRDTRDWLKGKGLGEVSIGRGDGEAMTMEALSKDGEEQTNTQVHSYKTPPPPTDVFIIVPEPLSIVCASFVLG